MAEQARKLPDLEKLTLVDALLEQLDRPDPEIDRIWAAESKARWQAYKQGKAESVTYSVVMEKYRS